MAPTEVNASPEKVILRIARSGPALPVMRVVVGGVASRQDLALEQLDDIQLALETILADESAEGGEFVLFVAVGAEGLSLRLEGLTNQGLKTALLATNPFQPCEGCFLDIRLFLSSLVDDYRVVEGDSGGFAVEMDKRAS
jgi:hypothetical protein